MDTISPQTAKSAVTQFLHSQFEKKTDKERKQLAKAKEAGDNAKVAELEQKISEIGEKYELEHWMSRAANWMSNQIGFGTHISKGINSSSRGDNINFSTRSGLPLGLVGHQSISNHKLDASGNAAALPLFSLFDYVILDKKKIKDFIIEDCDSFKLAFSENKELSNNYFDIFRNLLIAQPKKPETSEYNKQVLWYQENQQYICIIPLYPSSLTNHLYEKIGYVKYSNEISTIRKNRYNNNKKQESYPEIPNIAITIIGGSNPQGVSQLMSKQGGRNYLLPSLPPPSLAKAQAEATHTVIPSKFASSIFSSKQLAYQCKNAIERIFSVVKETRNTVDVRDKRKQALDEVLHIIFGIAETLRSSLPAGWSADYQLDMHQKLWLDPRRAELDGEEEFAQKRASDDWHKAVIDDFASWINQLLKAAFAAQKGDFGDAEYTEWEREIDDMQKQYERAGKGVFL